MAGPSAVHIKGASVALRCFPSRFLLSTLTLSSSALLHNLPTQTLFPPTLPYSLSPLPSLLFLFSLLYPLFYQPLFLSIPAMSANSTIIAKERLQHIVNTLGTPSSDLANAPRKVAPLTLSCSRFLAFKLLVTNAMRLSHSLLQTA